MIRALLFVALAAPIVAIAGPVAAEEKVDNAVAPAAEKKVCRKIGETGSRMAKRFCLTPTQWQQVDANNNQSASTILNRNADQVQH
ncbi:hypothetical protein [Novosphingobium sp. P6W]|uniref:hypothetical protein n=1 Tax=Novosphingobium sp. P6W TaxID=1609758 RepID=UPI0005C2C1F3|nr:hypothetical protein [Novosphingobium sp. P6W]AXB76794.1 hypothetical protein TQ38_010095 [Novosphingobium sp. P6W]KIS33352.1 hypothetical protein TQ38_08030 [Novosphingobium sp. P6W]